MAIEAMPEELVAVKARLEPGKMFLIDFDQERIIPDAELKASLQGEKQTAEGSKIEAEKAVAELETMRTAHAEVTATVGELRGEVSRLSEAPQDDAKWSEEKEKLMADLAEYKLELEGCKKELEQSASEIIRYRENEATQRSESQALFDSVVKLSMEQQSRGV